MVYFHTNKNTIIEILVLNKQRNYLIFRIISKSTCVSPAIADGMGGSFVTSGVVEGGGSPFALLLTLLVLVLPPVD